MFEGMSPMTTATPPAEIAITAASVRRLLTAQHPDLAALPLTPLGEGWDNAMFRLGDDLAVRLPRRAAAAQLIVHEQHWLPALAPWLTLPTPAPIRIGTADGKYPWSWSIVRWIAGEAADLAPPHPREAVRLAAFLKALHRRAPRDAPINDVRGVPLATRAAGVEERLARLRATTRAITPAVDAAWRAALTAPAAAEARWLHGDLHPRNILTRAGALAAVIDWGDITSGDLATDLAAFWMLFDDPYIRAQALTAYGATPAEIARARGWAVLFGAVLLDTGLADSPRHAAIGATTLARVAA